MFIELHMLQNFAPSNLNRSDTGSPKDCTFGGHRRARISSQCIKRAVRQHESFKNTVLAADGNVGTRTKRILKRLAELLADTGHSREDIFKVGEVMLAGVKLNMAEAKKKAGEAEDQEQDPEIKKTQYLLYLSDSEIQALADIARAHWDTLIDVEIATDDKADKKAKKKAGKDAVPKDIQKQIEEVLTKHPRLAADIALFGRMLADAKNMNIDAACQVAHALSTNKVASMEMDFFTAVDDLLPNEESGSDMMGIVEFNSACYYRYAQINLEILKRNLDGDQDQAVAAIKGFLQAAAEAVPTGMQNSMAAQNPPSYIRVLVRSSGAPWSLANAFVQPVRGDETKDLITHSAEKLEAYFGKLTGAYGADGIELDGKTSLVDGIDGVPLAQLLDQVTGKVAADWGKVR